jgi:hypothetical protein
MCLGTLDHIVDWDHAGPVVAGPIGSAGEVLGPQDLGRVSDASVISQRLLRMLIASLDPEMRISAAGVELHP